ncbi:unnamed protein product [Larinioides sclopetarius]|uniref:Ig-like domain-containing protein n=1 Tax=Larinioides sclopetarius TaxID=280406 RepID=A0AAV1Z790_9ARAC
MTHWIFVTLPILALCILFNSAAIDRKKEKTVGVPFYWSASSGKLISPKLRHFHPRLPVYEEHAYFHHTKHRVHNRRSSASSSSNHIRYLKPKPTKEPSNTTKVVCRDETQVFNGTDDEICPQFATPIGNISQAVGKEAKLECVVDNLGRFRVAWMRIETQTILIMHRQVISRNKRIGLSYSEHRTYVLHIKNVQEEDRGSYMCQVNTVPMMSQIGYLDVEVPPDINESESSSDMFVKEGIDIKLKCKAKGHPEPTLTWRREDYKPVRIGNWQKTKLGQNSSFFEGEELAIDKVSRIHMGAYLCIASNGVPPSVSRRITLQVHFQPMIWIPNQLVGARLGGNVTLECYTEAYPESMNYWTRPPNNDIVSNGDKYEVVLTVSTYKVHMAVTIRQINLTDYGRYECYSRNSVGGTKGTIRLYEIHSPLRIEEPSLTNIHNLNGVLESGFNLHAVFS